MALTQAVTQLSAPGKAEPKGRMLMSVQVSPQYCCNKSYYVRSGQLWRTEALEDTRVLR